MFILLKYILLNENMGQKVATVQDSFNLHEIGLTNLPETCSDTVISDIFIGSKEDLFDKCAMFKADKTIKIKDAVEMLPHFNKILYIMCKKIVNQLESVASVDAFKMLMTANTRKLIMKKKDPRNGKAELYNYLIDYLNQFKVEFTVQQHDEKEMFMGTMEQTLWLVDGHAKKFQDAPGVLPLPEVFTRQQFRKIEHEGMVKKKIPNLKTGDLISVATKLESLSCKSFVNSDIWKPILNHIQSLSASIHSYIEHLNRQTDNQNEKQIISESILTYIIEKKLPEDINLITLRTYESLAKSLKAVEPYTPINVKTVAPLDRKDRYLYIKRMQLTFDIQIYKSHQPFAVFVWRLPDNSRNDSLLAGAIKYIETKLIHELRSCSIQRISKEFEHSAKLTSTTFRTAIDFITGKTF